MGGEGAQRLSQVVGVVEEAVQPALTEGYAILEVTGGRNQPHNMVSIPRKASLLYSEKIYEQQCLKLFLRHLEKKNFI